MKISTQGDPRSLVGQEAFEIELRDEGDPFSASGTAEVEITFADGRTLLVYATDHGELRVEVD